MFSFEDTIERIPEQKTKEYFKEVYSSYCSSNYRSAVVMLWTVVVCDIIFKLQYLKDVYSDDKAKKILEEVEQKRTKSLEWETFLVDEVYKRTSFLNSYDKQNLDQIQKNRHLCAHPIITNNTLLQPTQERVRDLLRSALESILIKEPLLTKSIIDTFLNDLAEKKDRLTDFNNLKEYLNSRYFNNFSKDTALAIFKCLWKLVINARDEQELANQRVNCQAMYAIIHRFKPDCISEITKNPKIYGNPINQTTNDFGLDCAIEAFKNVDGLYSCFEDDAKLIAKNCIVNKRNVGFLENDHALNRFIPCLFLSVDLEQHLNNIIDRLGTEYLSLIKLEIKDLNNLYEKSRFADLLDLFYRMCIKVYYTRSSFDTSDVAFNKFIRPYMSDFSKDLCILLIKESNNNYQNGNNQNCVRRNAELDHTDFLKLFIEKGGSETDIADCDKWVPLLQQYERLSREEL